MFIKEKYPSSVVDQDTPPMNNFLPPIYSIIIIKITKKVKKKIDGILDDLKVYKNILKRKNIQNAYSHLVHPLY